MRNHARIYDGFALAIQAFLETGAPDRMVAREHRDVSRKRLQIASMPSPAHRLRQSHSCPQNLQISYHRHFKLRYVLVQLADLRQFMWAKNTLSTTRQRCTQPDG